MKKQSGFGLIEIIIIVAVIAAIGIGGWWVWQNNKSTTGQQSQQPSAATNNEQEVSPSILEIKELGIKIELSDAIKDAYYSSVNYPVALGGSAPGFGLRSLDSVPGCKVYAIKDLSGEYTINRGVAELSWDIYDADRISYGGDPAKSGFGSLPNASRVDNNWFAIDTANSTECKSSDAAIQAKIDAAKAAFEKAGKTITKI